MIVFDASALVGAALKSGSIPERPLLRAGKTDVLALLRPVLAEIAEVLTRPKFPSAIRPDRRAHVLATLQAAAAWFDPRIQITDCRDWKDNRYLELALASNAEIIVSSDQDLLVLDPWRGRWTILPADYLAARVSNDVKPRRTR